MYKYVLYNKTHRKHRETNVTGRKYKLTNVELCYYNLIFGTKVVKTVKPKANLVPVLQCNELGPQAYK